MASTVPYGFPSPADTVPPDVPADIQALAEAVNDEIVRVDSDIQTVSDAATAAALGWVPIGSGEEAATSAFVIDLTAGGAYPAGTFSLMRLYFRGDMDGSAQWLTLNINDSLTSESHRSSWLAYDADGALDESGNGDLTTWRLAYWSGVLIGNAATATLYSTDVDSFVSYEGTGTYIASGSTASRRSFSWGRLNENRLPSSLRVGRVGTDNIANCRWWAEGWRDA